MSSFPNSPHPVRGGIAAIEPDTAVPRAAKEVKP
jgi:hypothetical protein